MSKKAIATLQVDKEKWKQIKELAKEKGLSASAFIRQCVYQCLEREIIKKNQKNMV